MLVNFAWPRRPEQPDAEPERLLLNFHIGFLNGIPILWTVLVFIVLVGAHLLPGHGRHQGVRPGDRASGRAGAGGRCSLGDLDRAGWRAVPPGREPEGPGWRRGGRRAFPGRRIAAAGRHLRSAAAGLSRWAATAWRSARGEGDTGKHAATAALLARRDGGRGSHAAQAAADDRPAARHHGARADRGLAGRRHRGRPADARRPAADRARSGRLARGEPDDAAARAQRAGPARPRDQDGGPRRRHVRRRGQAGAGPDHAGRILRAAAPARQGGRRPGARGGADPGQPGRGGRARAGRRRTRCTTSGGSGSPTASRS